jgi:hypothetical protein
MRPVETVQGMGEGRQRRILEGRIQIWYIVRTLVNITRYPQYNNNMIIKWYLLKLLQESGEGEMKENGWGGKFMYDIFDTL